MMTIQHTIPGIGLRKVRLFPPTDTIYRYLQGNGEIERLRRLKHTGTIERALPGIPHSRYDYVASMLFVASRLRMPGTTVGATFGGVEFSSIAAAIQTLALLCNVGHLPGTFGVEKGVIQWLLERHPGSPSRALPWISEYFDASFAKELHRNLDGYLLAKDYGGLHRVLSVAKVCRKLIDKPDPTVRGMLVDFFIPYLLTERRAARQVAKWETIDRHYQTVRHISYLNLDASFADVPVQVDVAGLLEKFSENERQSEDLLEQAHEVLGAYEHAVYERLYHRAESRQVIATVAHLVKEKLEGCLSPKHILAQWLDASDIQEVVPEKALDKAEEHFERVASLSVRSLYLDTQARPAARELSLGKKVSESQAPACVLVYEPWERRHHDEPPHTYVDVFASGRPTPCHVGRVIAWFSNEMDKLGASLSEHGDTYDLLRKRDLGQVYASLVSDAVRLAWGKTLSLHPWPLADMGVGPPNMPPVAAWRGNWDLSDPHIKSMLRRKQTQVHKHLRATLAELRGLADLRDMLLKQDKKSSGPPKRRRQAHLVLTSSIRVIGENGKIDAEFDGGILRIASRSGRLTLHALETKAASTGQRALNDLEKKLRKLGVSASSIDKLGERSAHCALTLDPIVDQEVSRRFP